MPPVVSGDLRVVTHASDERCDTFMVPAEDPLKTN